MCGSHPTLPPQHSGTSEYMGTRDNINIRNQCKPPQHPTCLQAQQNLQAQQCGGMSPPWSVRKHQHRSWCEHNSDPSAAQQQYLKPAPAAIAATGKSRPVRSIIHSIASSHTPTEQRTQQKRASNNRKANAEQPVRLGADTANPTRRRNPQLWTDAIAT